MVDGFFKKMKDAIAGDDELQDSDYYQQTPPPSADPYSDLEDPYGNGAYGNNYEQFGDVRPASEDPYGDPADYGNNYEQFGDVRPASEDPYGDPADYGNNYGQYGDVRPASEDPYGDPADQEYYS
jgi:hypothetical protein